MIVSYNWLQEYFDEKLPPALELGDILNTRAFEVEGIEEKNGDFIIDMDVLPNRAHDCLSHFGIAREIGVLTGLSVRAINPEVSLGEASNISVTIEDEKLCRRYMALEISGVSVADSPPEIKNKLEVLGERSISNIVDITNLVMLETGQPLHAFDRDKLDGDIVVRLARKGEKITTLDNKEVELDETMLVIADQKDPLAIAGVKGGKKAEVDKNTKSIVLESANFLPVSVRKTRTKIGIQTESSKRFENEITPELAEKGILRAAEMVAKIAGGKVGALVDTYPRPRKFKPMTGVSVDEISSLLGIEISEKDIEKVLEDLGFEYKKVNTKEVAIQTAKDSVGRKHNIFPSLRFDAPDEFDCSTLTAYSYLQGGLPIPRLTVDQYVWGNKIDEKDLEPGDLIFSNSKEGKIHTKSVNFLPGTDVLEGIDHVMMYIGNDEAIHSTRYAGKVIQEKFTEASNYENIVGYRRMTGGDEERYVVTVPHERLDINQPEDLIEEIGRVYGYEKIEEKPISEMDFTAKINKEYYYNNLIRKNLVDLGFSEVFTYTFVEVGEVAPIKPIAEDKKYLRTSLLDGMQKSLKLNLHNADLLGLDHVRIFEIGKVYFKDGESLALSIGVVNNKVKKPKADDLIEGALEKLSENLGVKISGKIDEGKVEINLDDLYSNALDPRDYVEFDEIGEVKYKIPSQFPFVTRDISVWVSGNDKKDEVLNLIKQNAGELLVNNKLVDVYQKDDKTSYSFRLIFQSFEKTLTDEVVNDVMDKISAEMTKEGFEVR